MKISEKFQKIRARLDDAQPTESTKKQSDHFEILVDLPIYIVENNKNSLKA